MNILIATGVYPPKVGGPAQYAINLDKVWKKQGHFVRVAAYNIEHKLPKGLSHLVFFFKTLFKLPGIDFCLALDTFSAGVPAMLACKIMRKPLVVRVGGDFLWESYLNRTHEPIMLSDFYNKERSFTNKERIIFNLSKWLFNNSDGIAFNTRWQANIFARPYNLNMEKVFVVENYYGPKKESIPPHNKNYLWHVRETFFKNKEMLLDAFKLSKKDCSEVKLEIGKIPYDELMQKMRDCYAVIQPSISDVSPNYVMEALSYNKPTIMTEDTGLREKLEGIAIFVNPFNVKEISEAICWLAKPENYQEQVKKIENFRYSHSWEDIAKEFLEIANAKIAK